MRLKINLLTAILLGLPAIAWALPSDREKPINIEADHAQLDDREGVTQYKGDAILTQGTLTITGDIITFYYDENQRLTKAVAQGNLATYEQIHKEGDPPVKAKALQMEYYADRQKLYLIGKGHVWQQGDEFTGNHIEYDIERDFVTANSSPINVGGEDQPKGRVHVIIQPQNGGTNTTNKTSTKPVVKETINGNDENATSSQSSTTSYPKAITTTRLNIRTGPNTTYERIGSLPNGLEVLVLTRQEEWVQVHAEVNGESIIGWVNSQYLEDR